MACYFEVDELFGQSFEFEISKHYREQIGFAESSNLPEKLIDTSSGDYTIFCTYGKLRIHLHIERGESKRYRVFYSVTEIIRKNRNMR